MSDYIHLNPAKDTILLRKRINSFFNTLRNKNDRNNLNLDFFNPTDDCFYESGYPYSNVCAFLDYICIKLGDGDIFLFGGLIRDLAMFGQKGFNSDIDVVVDGLWDELKSELLLNGARLNKFGGLRLAVDGWPIDIWNARDTWAFKVGILEFNGVESLLGSTVLNWDGILMNWRTKSFLHKNNYFEQIGNRILDVVLVENPNPLGMLVRVLRHLSQKDAKQYSERAFKYLVNETKKYTFDTFFNYERKAYGKPIVDFKLYKFFEMFEFGSHESLRLVYSEKCKYLQKRLSVPSISQANLALPY